jgi:hypothetical protein
MKDLEYLAGDWQARLPYDNLNVLASVES